MGDRPIGAPWSTRGADVDDVPIDHYRQHTMSGVEPEHRNSIKRKGWCALANLPPTAARWSPRKGDAAKLAI